MTAKSKAPKLTEEEGNRDGKNSTAGFVSGLYKAVLPLEDIFDSAGMDLPTYLGTKQDPGVDFVK